MTSDERVIIRDNIHLRISKIDSPTLGSSNPSFVCFLIVLILTEMSVVHYPSTFEGLKGHAERLMI